MTPANFQKKIRAFAATEDGAVTVDWVVLSAAVISLAMVAFWGVDGGIRGLTGNIKTTLSTAEVRTPLIANQSR